jgi:hypothetical protein
MGFLRSGLGLAMLAMVSSRADEPVSLGFRAVLDEARLVGPPDPDAADVWRLTLLGERLAAPAEYAPPGFEYLTERPPLRTQVGTFTGAGATPSIRPPLRAPTVPAYYRQPLRERAPGDPPSEPAEAPAVEVAPKPRLPPEEKPYVRFTLPEPRRAE